MTDTKATAKPAAEQKATTRAPRGKSEDAAPAVVQPSEVANKAETTAADRDKAAVDKWREAASASSSAADLTALREKAADAQKSADALFDNYAEQAARRALVYGWTTVANEIGVSPKQLHAWRNRYASDAPDLSEIPVREMRREERRLEKIEKELKQQEELKALQTEAANRIKEIKGYLN